MRSKTPDYKNRRLTVPGEPTNAQKEQRYREQTRIAKEAEGPKDLDQLMAMLRGRAARAEMFHLACQRRDHLLPD